jgi:hypothetical protein
MMELESMAVEMPEVEGHPNRTGFRGVLTVVDVASQRAPSGSKGRRVVLMRAAAEAALPSLLGMALDYAPTLDRHDQRRKVGVITSAEVVGRNLEVGGYLYAKDFPEIVEEIARAGGRGEPSATGRQPSGKTLTTEGTAEHRGNRQTPGRGPETLDCGPRTADLRRRTSGMSLRRALVAAAEGIRELAKIPTLPQKARRGWGNRTKGVQVPSLAAESAVGMGQALGMSFEVADVTVMDTRAQVWILTHVVFTGAAILRRDKAAYEDTWIELVASCES